MALKHLIKKTIVKLLPNAIKSDLQKSFLLHSAKQNEFINLSYSQEGEDLVLFRFLENKRTGFYIDVGAHHPKRFSNTYKFYLLGWKGINIDPLPGSMSMFNILRNRDINLEVPILNDTSKNLTYFMFDEPALNTFDEALAISREADTPYKIVDKILLKPYKLSEILEKNLPAEQVIDFLSIDVEGMDLEVLQSNDWEKFRPYYIIAESVATNLMEDLKSPISLFLKDKGYELISKTANSLVYKELNIIL